MGMTTDQLLTTTRAVRKRLDLDRPVETEVIRECLEIAMQAPSGSNIQPWRMLVITDADKRQRISSFYREAYRLYKRDTLPTLRAAFEATGQGAQMWRINSSAEYLAEHLHKVPILIIPCLLGGNPYPPRLEQAPNFLAASAWGSVYPAVWSFMLAARVRGLGTSITTLHLVYEREIAEVLGIPYEKVTQVALIPVAYTKGTDFKPAPRKPIEDVFSVDSW